MDNHAQETDAVDLSFPCCMHFDHETSAHDPLGQTKQTTSNSVMLLHQTAAASVQHWIWHCHPAPSNDSVITPSWYVLHWHFCC